jgi:glutaredoxin
MGAVRLVLYSRPGCHLCDEMKQIVASLAPEHDFTLAEVDVSADARLENIFGAEVPVLFVNDRKAFKYRVTAAELRRRLRREGRRR